jgi:hypothetical protein
MHHPQETNLSTASRPIYNVQNLQCTLWTWKCKYTKYIHKPAFLPLFVP